MACEHLRGENLCMGRRENAIIVDKRVGFFQFDEYLCRYIVAMYNIAKFVRKNDLTFLCGNEMTIFLPRNLE